MKRLTCILAGVFLCILPKADASTLQSPARPGNPAQYDLQGREILSATGEQYLMDDSAHPALPLPEPTRGSTPEMFSRRAGLSAESIAPAAASGELQVTREWFRSIFGYNIGSKGLYVVDVDADGHSEAVISAGSYWYIASSQGKEYVQRWVSSNGLSISALRVAQFDADPALEIFVANGNQLQVYDGATLTVQKTLTLPSSVATGLTVADVDADGALELVFSDATYFSNSTLFILDANTGAVEFRGTNMGGSSFAVGQVDGDAALEIVVNTGTVVDGQSRAVEWNNPDTFGGIVRVGDLDGDGLDEIVAGYAWTTGLRVYQGDTRQLSYSVPVFNLAAVRVADVEGDGTQEIVYGDAQWGSIHILNGATGAEKWKVSNPEHGVTEIAVGNADADGAREIFWGAGATSTGPDRLYVADAVTHVRDWQSLDISGPFYALTASDVDGDGQVELLSGSYTSDSSYGDGLFFIHDGATHALEYQSGEPTGLDWTGLWRIRTANVDADPQQEIFVTSSITYDAVLLCYDGLTHAEQWRIKLDDVSFRGMQLADVDGDGVLEVVTSVANQTGGTVGIYVYNAATGALKWSTPTPGVSSLSLLRVANVDEDPALEIIAAQSSLFIIDAATRTVQLTTGTLGVSALETVDMNGDGRSEILIGTSSGAIQVINATTGTVSQTLYSTTGSINGLGVVDLTSDGVKDYVFANGERLRIVNGSSRAEAWSSEVLGTNVGAQDSLLVADLDGDQRPEITVNVGTNGFMIFDVGPGGGMASYDPVLQTPRCGTADVSCDSGLLLLGRGLLGPEPNASNTLYGSCEDGNAGTFHVDESNDRIRVVSVDGTPFAAGKTVRIDATVWAWTQPAGDRLDLYTAADAGAPDWQFLTTLKPSAPGAQTLSTTYVLPTGTLQAVRARFRTQGSAPCGAGTYSDTDDLVFTVK
ncbi:FG-GAP-like repeat-containing protein [Hyalangium versicolor]|uniref:FG-GAP-like repeat-containing protein n=1 Tax=Hyalangium versicolor TaxID=2861190 RepID=UPI001CCF7287|nr:FG-GAP-like repeat-containing protein [Hyalangium versicolor]